MAETDVRVEIGFEGGLIAGMNGEQRSDNEHGAAAAYGERHGSYCLRAQSRKSVVFEWPTSM